MAVRFQHSLMPQIMVGLIWVDKSYPMLPC